MKLTPENIAKSIATGNWKPNMYLTNVSIAYLQKPENVAKGLRLFQEYLYKLQQDTITNMIKQP